MENDEEIKVDLSKYKGHNRKFPWALVMRIIVAGVLIGACFVLIRFFSELESPADEEQEKDTEIEIEYEP